MTPFRVRAQVSEFVNRALLAVVLDADRAGGGYVSRPLKTFSSVLWDLENLAMLQISS